MDFKITNHQITKLNIDFNQAKNTNEMADMLLSFNIRVPEDKNDHQYKIIIKVSFNINDVQLFLMQEDIEIELNKDVHNMDSNKLVEYIKNTCFEDTYKIFQQSYAQVLKAINVNYIDLPTFDEIKSKF